VHTHTCRPRSFPSLRAMGTAVPALIDHDGLFAGVRDLSAFGGETRTGYSLARHHSTSYLALVISLLSILLAKKEYPWASASRGTKYPCT
jgi:hypothetical protein